MSQGKRIAALGKQPSMNASLFPSFVFSRLEAWKTQNSGKGREGSGGVYPGRRPACAALRRALPWAGMLLPLWGAGDPRSLALLAPDPNFPEGLV